MHSDPLFETSAIRTPDLSLSRNNFDKLVMTLADGTIHEDVVPIRVFPTSAADEGLSLMSTDGRGLVQITQPDAPPTPMRALIEAELDAREFMPETRTIVGISTYATPSTWAVQTDRGQTDLVLRSEEDIYRLTGATLLVSGSHSIHYLIRDLLALSKHSRKILGWFL